MKSKVKLVALVFVVISVLIALPLKWTAPLLATRVFVQSSMIREEEAEQLRVKAWNDLYLFGRYEEALQTNQKALEIYQSIGDRLGEAMTLNNMGLVRQDQYLYPQALQFFQQSLIIRREIGDKEGVIKVLYNIGTVYQVQAQYPLALKYYEHALAEAREVNNSEWQRSILHKIEEVEQHMR